MRLRRFNEKGIARFEQILDSDPAGTDPIPESVLQDDALTDVISPPVEIERRSFPRRYDLAEYLYGLLRGSGLLEPERDKGLWAWLAAYYFDVVCPAGRDGKRKPGERARLVPALDQSRRYYRHLILGPYMIYRRHADHPACAMVLLAQEPHKPGDVVEQLASRADLVNCRAVVGAASVLYCNDDGRIKKGAGGKQAGSARRLGEVLVQLDLTFDLQSMDPESLLRVLPAEFARWSGGSEREQGSESGGGRGGPRGSQGLLRRIQEILVRPR